MRQCANIQYRHSNNIVLADCHSGGRCRVRDAWYRGRNHWQSSGQSLIDDGINSASKKIILDDLIKISNLVSLINVGLEWTENFECNDVCLQELFAKMDQNSDGYSHIIDIIKMIALKRSSIHVVA